MSSALWNVGGIPSETTVSGDWRRIHPGDKIGGAAWCRWMIVLVQATHSRVTSKAKRNFTRNMIKQLLTLCFVIFGSFCRFEPLLFQQPIFLLFRLEPIAP